MNIAPSQSAVNDGTRDYALALHRLGFNVLPIHSDSKAPNVPTWGEYCTRVQNEQEVAAFAWAQNIAVINGVNDLRSLDLDECNDAELLFKVLELLGLDYSYPWVVHSPGKGGGFHVYVKCPDSLTLTSNGVLVGDPLDSSAFKQIELRWAACYNLFPPSIHPETKTAYTWAFDVPAMDKLAVVSVAVVERTFLTLAAPRGADGKPSKVARFDAWAQRALEQEVSNLRGSSEGGRNTQLNKSAFCLGQIVGAGLLTENEVESELERAALAVGLEEKETSATIKSGLEAGKKKPRMPRQIFKQNEPALKLAPARSPDDEKLVAFSADDQGHAEAVYSLYGPFIAFNSAYGWLIWNGTNFVPSVQRINSLIVEVLRLRQRAAVHLERTDILKVSRPMAGTVAATRTMLENLAYVPVEEFDNEQDLINTASGIVNLRSKTLIPHDPIYRFTWCSPVRYNPAAVSPVWLDFINSTVPSGIVADYLQEALGYSVSGHTSEECLFYIFGPPRSGKGTLSETILSIFPRPVAIEVDFNTFTAKREGDSQNFDLAPLKASRLVFASESNKYQSLNPAKIKQLTGGNDVYCAFKYGAHFGYKPLYTVWLSSNWEISADADDEALWGRVKVVPFPYSRLGQEDKSLKTRMKSPENLEFVLSWLINGAYRWYQRGGVGLITPYAVTETTSKQRSMQDSVGLWLEECCKLDADMWIENSRLRTSYETWCENNGYEAKKAKGFSQSLAAHGLQISVSKWQADISDAKGGKMVKGVQGLALL